jgi:hypothetical protein
MLVTLSRLSHSSFVPHQHLSGGKAPEQRRHWRWGELDAGRGFQHASAKIATMMAKIMNIKRARYACSNITAISVESVRCALRGGISNVFFCFFPLIFQGMAIG